MYDSLCTCTYPHMHNRPCSYEYKLACICMATEIIVETTIYKAAEVLLFAVD